MKAAPQSINRTLFPFPSSQPLYERAMALKDKILMVSIYPSHNVTLTNVPDVKKRVDTFIERLRKVSKQEVRPSTRPSYLHHPCPTPLC